MVSIDVDICRLRAVAARLEDAAALLLPPSDGLGGPVPWSGAAAAHDRTAQDWARYLGVLRGAVAATGDGLDRVAAAYGQAHAAAGALFGGPPGPRGTGSTLA
jgi:hypothetical protein